MERDRYGAGDDADDGWSRQRYTDLGKASRGRGGGGVPPGAALLVLRLFLGVTFAYAGVQKLSDPGFLHPGAPTYIGTQLRGFAAGTPAGFILRTFAIPHAELAGVMVAIVEVAIGLCVLLGLVTRWAAAGGMALNLFFFLTASWRTSPYFLGSDIVFVFAWLPFVLTGSSGQPALDRLIERGSPRLAQRMQALFGDRDARLGQGEVSALTRRALLAQVALATLALAGVTALVKGRYSAQRLVGAGGSSPKPNGPAVASTPARGGQEANTSTTASTTADAGLPANAVKLGPASRLPRGEAVLYRDPASGQPDILIHLQNGDFNAFSAVCTHAGCTVGYQGGEIACPCHGGVYSAQTGQVLAGPPPLPLARREVREVGGEIYAIPA
ncbi:MAG: TQO small subunit DoxD [Solirubrobacteraceae bacterium]